MTARDVLLDPSVLFDRRALGLLRDLQGEPDMNVHLPSALNPSVLGRITDAQFSAMSQHYGIGVDGAFLPSFQELTTAVERADLAYYTWRDDRDRLPTMFDPTRIQRTEAGWQGATDVDELCFLATHSSVIVRVRKREDDLVQTLRRILVDRLSAWHITIEGPGAPNLRSEVAQKLVGVAPWLIWLASAPVVATAVTILAPPLGMLPPWTQQLPWAVEGAVLFSFRP